MLLSLLEMTHQKKHVVAVAWLVSSVDLDSSDSGLLVFLSLEGPGCLKLLIPGIVLSLFCPGLQAGMAAFFFFFFVFSEVGCLTV